MFEGRVPKERVDRLQREPPDLRAGILQRLGENLGHLFAWTTQKPVHDILGEEDFPVGGVRPRRLDDLALFEPCQRGDHRLLHPRVIEEQVGQRRGHPLVADASQDRDGREPHVLVLIGQHLQQRVDRLRPHVHENLPDLVADAPAQGPVLERLHQRSDRIGADAHQGIGGSQLQRSLAAREDADQGFHGLAVPHVAQPVDCLQHDLLGPVGQSLAQPFHRRRPADAAQGRHRALADILVGIRQRFAHESESEFARLLDSYGIRWEYEPRSFPLQWDEQGRVVESFNPDFYLPDIDLYIELTTLKQSLVTKKNRKLRRLRELYPAIRVKIFYGRDYRSLLLKYGLAKPAARSPSA